MTELPELLTPSQKTISSEMDEFLDFITKKRGLSLNTRTAYGSDLRSAAAILTKPIIKINCSDIEQFLFSHKEAVATTNRRIVSLRQFFRWAQRQGYRLDNPLDLMEQKRANEKPPCLIKNRDLPKLLSAIAAAPQPYSLIFMILRETGMRVDEVLGLNINDVNLDTGNESLKIYTSNSNHKRTVVLVSEVMPYTVSGLYDLMENLEFNPKENQPLFRSNRGTRITYDALHYRWVQLCVSAELVDQIDGIIKHRYTIHQLRYTVATELITSYPEHIVSQVLGYRDPRSTRRYIPPSDDQIRSLLSLGVHK